MTKNFYVWITVFIVLIVTTAAIVMFSQPANVPIVFGVHPVDLATDVTGELVTANIADDTILEADLDATNSPTVGYFPAYEAGGGFTWTAASGGGTHPVALATDVSGVLPLANGGTNATTAAGARTSLNVDVAGTENTTWESDMWRLTSAATGDGALTANLERVDTGGQGKSGVGMSEASGIFSFPETGTYYVHFQGYFIAASGADPVAGLEIWTTEDDSSYAAAAISATSLYTTGAHNTGYAGLLLNVDDISNVKVRFHRSSMFSSNTIHGSTTYNYTIMYFSRVGDSS